MLQCQNVALQSILPPKFPNKKIKILKITESSIISILISDSSQAFRISEASASSFFVKRHSSHFALAFKFQRKTSVNVLSQETAPTAGAPSSDDSLTSHVYLSASACTNPADLICQITHLSPSSHLYLLSRAFCDYPSPHLVMIH